ncbi:MAG: PhpK family radical SAM P-methyltransferase [Candidatus Aminicenantes bacterium]|nr:MAG: PhpK family radical SAM P-methyltransferase [Candidatus Aminicenantes bacterium]
MSKIIDCLLIGHNQVNFDEYIKRIQKMGKNSGAYRDLNLSFLQYDGKPYHAAGMFNYIQSHYLSNQKNFKPLCNKDTFSAAISYLGTYLSRRKLTFDYILSFQEEKQKLAEKLTKDNILTIAITTTLYITVFPILEIMNFIKQYNQTARVIIGGPFIATQIRAADPGTLQFLFDSVGADIYVNSSQGEAALVKIIHALKNDLPLNEIPNIHYKTGNGYQAAPLVKENNKLSENMVNWNLFADKTNEYVNIRTSISCPFACAFCGFPEHAGQYQTADIEAIERELNSLKKITTVKSLYFIDDTINVPIKRFKEFLKMLNKNKYSFRWQSQIRCQYLDRETVKLMKQSGCEGVFLGLESGNNQILKNMNKKGSLEEYKKGIQLLKKYDIITFGSFIAGFPGETQETLQETAHFIEESEIDFYRAQLWYCETITPIWKQKEKYNIKGSNFEWSHGTMNSREAADLVEEMFLTINQSTWLPQYQFDFNTLFHLTNRGLNLNQIKGFITIFNQGIKEKLIHPGKDEVSKELIHRLAKTITSPSLDYLNGMRENTENHHLANIDIAEVPIIHEEDLQADFDLDWNINQE